MKANKGCGKLLSNDTFFADRCFRVAKTIEEKISKGLYYCGSAKTSHKGFFLAKLEKLMKEWPVGSHLFMKSMPRVHGDRPLMVIGYKYRSQKVLGFISK